jgi:chemotaxis protein MotA
MFAIIGIFVVFGAVVGGYLMEKGHLAVLVQPAELVIIGGAAIGTVLIANPPRILTDILKGVMGAFKASKFTRDFYLKSLKMLYDLFDLARRTGLPALEAEVEDPSKGKTFVAHAEITKDHHITAFVCDTLRTMMLGGVDAFDFDQMLERENEVNHHEATTSIAALSTMADALPGLGIVAAVLGVVITMGALGGPPEEIGHKVAAALVGTFLGILLCYGLVGPLAASMSKAADAENEYYHFLHVSLSAFNKGLPPILATEMGRRTIPRHNRPSFADLEKTCRNRGGAQPAQAEQAA